MTRPVSDHEVEAAFTAWARDSVVATASRSFTVPDSEGQRPLPPKRSRHLPAVLAAATVVALVAVGLAARYAGHEKAPAATGSPTTRVTKCPRHLALGAAPTPRNGLPLFARPVAEMIACSYGGRRMSRLVAAVALGHRLSTQLAQHFNDAPTKNNDPLDCLAIPSFSLLLARDVHGHPLPPVSLIFGCRQISATNGTTTRSLYLTDPAFRQANRYVSSHR